MFATNHGMLQEGFRAGYFPIYLQREQTRHVLSLKEICYILAISPFMFRPIQTVYCLRLRSLPPAVDLCLTTIVEATWFYTYFHTAQTSSKPCAWCTSHLDTRGTQCQGTGRSSVGMLRTDKQRIACHQWG